MVYANLNTGDRLENERQFRSWSGSSEFGKISGELAILTGNRFQRAIAPFLRVLFPGIIEAPNLDKIDRAGLDYVVWSEEYIFPVGVQAKGWEVSADKLGYSQIRQCDESLAALAKRKDIEVGKYVFIHNRDSRSRGFREGIDVLKRKYVGGQIGEIEFWDRRDFLNKVFDAVKYKLIDSLYNDARRKFALGLDLVQSLVSVDPIKIVPLASRLAKADQHQLTFEGQLTELYEDPAKVILAEDETTELILLIGEFGYGKSTAVLRALALSETPLLFVQGASLNKSLTSTNDFLAKCFEEAKLLHQFYDDDVLLLSRIVRAVAFYLFSTRVIKTRLVIDCLDESPLLTRSDGFQTLFNWLKDLDVPIVLTLRAEMWYARKESFLFSQGIKSKTNKGRSQQFRLIELLPWNDEQILRLTDEYHDRAENDEEKMRLVQFRELVISHRYSEIYGDIPRRPLFLHIVLSSVISSGIPDGCLGKARLFRKWILDKVRRDTYNPLSHGGVNRVSLMDSFSIEQTLEYSWKIMTIAAGEMVQIFEGEKELVETCCLNNVIRKTGLNLELINVLGVFLNSLLLPVNREMPFEKVRVRFAHRACQEFFLAWHILDSEGTCFEEEFPVSVQEWVSALKKENVWRK